MATMTAMWAAAVPPRRCQLGAARRQRTTRLRAATRMRLAGARARAEALVVANQHAEEYAALAAKARARRESAEKAALRAASRSNETVVAATLAANRRKLKDMEAQLAEFGKAKADAHALDVGVKVRRRKWKRSAAAHKQAVKDAGAAKRQTSAARARMIQLEVNLNQKETRETNSRKEEAGENDRSAEQLLQQWRTTEERGKLMFAEAIKKAQKRQAVEMAPPTAVHLMQSWRDAEEQGRRMVSNAIESAQWRNHAPRESESGAV